MSRVRVAHVKHSAEPLALFTHSFLIIWDPKLRAYVIEFGVATNQIKHIWRKQKEDNTREHIVSLHIGMMGCIDVGNSQSYPNASYIFYFLELIFKRTRFFNTVFRSTLIISLFLYISDTFLHVASHSMGNIVTSHTGVTSYFRYIINLTQLLRIN